VRILFLDHPQHTHGTWTLHQALGRVLGWDAVVDFPCKETFRGRDHDLLGDPDYAPLYEAARGGAPPSGIPPFAPGEQLSPSVVDWKEIGGHHQLTTQRRYSWQEVVSDIRAFDLIVLGNSHRVPTITLALLRDRCGGRNRLPPIVYLDAGERDEFNAHWWHVFRPELNFKQILTPTVAANPNASCTLHPLPLANAFVTNAGILRSCNVGGPKVRDVLFHHGITWEPRENVLQTVRDWLRESGGSGAEHTWEWGSLYFAGIASSRMALSIRGSGRDTTRYWEIPALESLLVADGTMGAIHPFPFRDGQTAAFYTSLGELASKLDFYHRNEEARQSVARAGRAWVERWHSFEARALFFLGTVQEHLRLRYTPEQQRRVSGWRARLGWPSALPDWSGPVVGYEV
jgi:hypothetical protein